MSRNEMFLLSKTRRFQVIGETEIVFHDAVVLLATARVLVCPQISSASLNNRIAQVTLQCLNLSQSSVCCITCAYCQVIMMQLKSFVQIVNALLPFELFEYVFISLMLSATFWIIFNLFPFFFSATNSSHVKHRMCVCMCTSVHARTHKYIH